MIYRVDKFKDMFEGIENYDDKYFYNFEGFDNLPKGYIEDFVIQLKNHPDYDSIKENFIIDEKNNRLIQIHEKIPIKEIEDLTNEERFFYPLCSKDEIKRIFNVKDSEDYLLKYRAEQVVDNQRLHRVFDSIRLKNKNNWSFSNYTDTKLYETYLNYLPKNEQEVCKNIPHGTIHIDSANGYCIKTPFGNVIVISHALRMFLYYMNLFHFGEQLGFKSSDVLPSFILAVRILMGKEALDFEIDSRGELPQNIHIQIDNATDWQMLFVIGHEYAHHYLSHLDKKSVKSLNSFENKDFKYYTFRQKNELEADLHSIIKPKLKQSERTDLADAAFLFFIWLDLFNTVEQYMSPSNGLPSTHPEPIDRMWELRNKLDDKYGMSKNSLQKLMEFYKGFKTTLLKDFLPFNIEKIEIYGSVYLPSYKKNKKHDRLL